MSGTPSSLQLCICWGCLCVYLDRNAAQTTAGCRIQAEAGLTGLTDGLLNLDERFSKNGTGRYVLNSGGTQSARVTVRPNMHASV